MGGQELKWRQLAYHQLMSQQGPHFSPHSDVLTASLYSEKIRLKKLMIMIIVMNKSQETTFFHSARN